MPFWLNNWRDLQHFMTGFDQPPARETRSFMSASSPRGREAAAGVEIDYSRTRLNGHG